MAVCIHLLNQYYCPLLQKQATVRVSASFGVGTQFSSLFFKPLRSMKVFYKTHLYWGHKYWENESSIVASTIPNVLLIGPDKETLVAFGYKAKLKYKELVQYGNNNDFYYFPHFGMDLREEFRKVRHWLYQLQVSGRYITSLIFMEPIAF